MSLGRMTMLHPFKDNLRCALLILVVTAMEAVYVLEQPSTSLLMLHERFVWLVATLENLGIKVPPFMCWHFFAPARYLVGVSVRVPVSRSTTNTFIVL